MTTWSLPNGAFRLSGEEAGGMPNFAKSLREGFQTVASQYKPKQAAEELLAQRLLNAINKPKADNADQWFQAELNNKNLQGSILGQQLQEALFFNQNPLHRLLKAGGPAAQVGAMMLLRDQQGGGGDTRSQESLPSGGGYHSEGGGSGYDLPTNYFPATPSSYANEANNRNPTLDKAIDTLPAERREKFKRMFGDSESGPMNMTLSKGANQQQPNYAKMLEDAFSSNLTGKQVLNDYRKSLTETSAKRAATPITKLNQEVEEVRAGYLPGTNGQHRISPEQQDELLGSYKLQLQKHVTDTDTRKKSLFASNIDKTIDSIDTKDLTRYAGPKGAMKLRGEEIKAALKPGSESEDYRKYLENVNRAKLMSKQVRQFYGDSIQPEVRKDLERLSNPATWRNNPEIATRLFDSFTGLLKQETGTYRGALKSTREFEGASGKTKVFYNGKPHMIPNDKVQEALKHGGTLNG